MNCLSFYVVFLRMDEGILRAPAFRPSTTVVPAEEDVVKDNFPSFHVAMVAKGTGLTTARCHNTTVMLAHEAVEKVDFSSFYVASCEACRRRCTHTNAPPPHNRHACAREHPVDALKSL
jgi:hypothetical protein